MRLVIGCALPVALALGGCAAPVTEGLSLSVGNGSGSEFGNYAAQADGEMLSPSGERCVIYNWDRPLTRDLAVRLRSASCESKAHPRWMECVELSRTVIPMAQSTLRDATDPWLAASNAPFPLAR